MAWYAQQKFHFKLWSPIKANGGLVVFGPYIRLWIDGEPVDHTQSAWAIKREFFDGRTMTESAMKFGAAKATAEGEG